MKPIVFDLFCGLGGWSEAFIAEGYRAIGFDIEAHDYGKGCYPGELFLRDIRTINGADLVKQYGVPTCIVASPPCQAFSYMAMPWSKAKEKRRKIVDDKSGKLLAELNDLFNQCFRIQREVSEAAGKYIPMVIENVRGAQEWVGRSKSNFGSYHLWGDVPALLPIPAKNDGIKAPGLKWSDEQSHGKNVLGILGRKGAVSFTDAAGFATRMQAEGTKGFKNFILGYSRQFGSKSNARKKAAAEIAKIPFSLAQWIAKTFKPRKQLV